MKACQDGIAGDKTAIEEYLAAIEERKEREKLERELKIKQTKRARKLAIVLSLLSVLVFYSITSGLAINYNGLEDALGMNIIPFILECIAIIVITRYYSPFVLVGIADAYLLIGDVLLYALQSSGPRFLIILVAEAVFNIVVAIVCNKKVETCDKTLEEL